MTYEVFGMSPNGTFLGSFDDPDEATELFKWAREKKHDVVTRVAQNDGTILKEKRFINDEKAFSSGLESSIVVLNDALGALNHTNADQELYDLYFWDMRYAAFTKCGINGAVLVEHDLTFDQVLKCMSDARNDPGYGTEWIYIYKS